MYLPRVGSYRCHPVPTTSRVDDKFHRLVTVADTLNAKAPVVSNRSKGEAWSRVPATGTRPVEMFSVPRRTVRSAVSSQSVLQRTALECPVEMSQ